MTDRHTVDSINSDQLDQLYDDLARTRQELADRDEGESADASAGSYAGRAEAVEAQLARATDLYEQWVKAGPPPLGTPMARWWDRRLVELRGAIHTPAEESSRTTPDNPPGSTAEQLPDEILAAIRPGPYLSTACHAAFLCETTEPTDTLTGWPQRLHARCRINNKFTGKTCVCGCHAPKEQP